MLFSVVWVRTNFVCNKFSSPAGAIRDESLLSTSAGLLYGGFMYVPFAVIAASRLG
jgi:hypothetical protein